jgi:hypothetical protein
MAMQCHSLWDLSDDKEVGKIGREVGSSVYNFNAFITLLLYSNHCSHRISKKHTTTSNT